MLRTKQIGTISQCARSFFYNGTRCGSGDGASCTCTDDETRFRRQSDSENFQVKGKKPNAGFGPVFNAGAPHFRKVIGSVSNNNAEALTSRASDLQGSCSTSSARSHLVPADRKTIHERQNVVHASKLSAERFIQEGLATISAVSNTVHYQTSKEDSRGHSAPVNYLIDNGQPLSNIKASRSKQKAWGGYTKNQSTSSIRTAGGSSCTFSATSDHEAKTFKETTHNAKQNVDGTSSMFHGTLSVARGSTRSLPQKPKFNSGSFVSDSGYGESFHGRKGPAVVPADSARSAAKFQPSFRSMRSQPSHSRSGTRWINSTRIVEEYYQTLQHMKWGPSTEKALANLQFKIDPFQANQVLKLLHDHSVALGFFNWLKHQPKFKHDEHTYTTMIGILGQARQFDAIHWLMEEMYKDACQPTVVTYNRLIHAYGRANYINDAVSMFHEMQDAGLEPDRVTYCTLIDIHAKAGYLDVALEMYQKMQDVGLSPDTFTYSVMVNCLGKGGHLAAAYKLFCEMIEHGCTPNLVTFNIMIALQAKARNYPNVVKLYHDMQTAGFRPDKITYSIVMEVLGHCGRLDEVEEVFVEMQHDWIPDEPAYGLLVDLWGKAGNVEKAQAWYQSMLDAGLRPNVPTCNSLLSAFLKVGRFSDAYFVLQNMVQLELIPSLQTYTLLLSCCTEAPSQIGMCCKLMAITGHPAHTFLVSLPDAEPGGWNVRDHASCFLDMMHSEDRESKRGIVDAVIDFLHKSGLKEEAGSVWEVAAQRNIYPDSIREKCSSYWLINLHVMSEGTALTALSRTLAWFRRQMLASGVGPSRIDIITGWGRRSRVTGSSLVRQSVQELLLAFGFPFFTECGNSGCFVGCGDTLNRWLHNSYVERMHLL